MPQILVSILTILGILIVSYFIGSFPSAIFIGKVFYGVDVRTMGSHNAGGTNVGRVIGKKAGFITIGLDVLKTVISIWVPFFILTLFPFSTYLLPTTIIPLEVYYYLGGIGAAIGHCYPIFSGFKGGKAMSVFSGFVFATNPVLSVLGLSCFLGIFFWKKYVSLASITAPFIVFLLSLLIAVFPVLNCTAYFFHPAIRMIQSSYIYSIYLLVIAIYVIIRHIPNIKRLLNHTEPYTHFKKTPSIKESASENK